MIILGDGDSSDSNRWFGFPSVSARSLSAGSAGEGGTVNHRLQPPHWLDIAGRRVQVDARGYLLDTSDWDETLAEALAASDGLRLSDDHWRVLRFLRGYYAQHGRSPAMRVLVKGLADQLGSEHANSRVLYRLFPQGPAKQAARYAGLPRPTSCV